VRRTEVVEIIVDRVDLLEKVRQSKVRDDKVVKAVEEMKRAGVKMLRDKEWREVDGIIYKEEKVYVPKDDKLRVKIIRLHHDMPIEGHCHVCVEQGRNNPEWNRVILRKKGIDNKIGEQPWPQLMCYASIYYHVWLHISGGQNCCQEFRRGIVYRLMEARIEHIRDVNL